MKSLQDHTYFSVIVRSQPSTSLDSLVNSFPAFLAAQAEYAENRTGPFTSPGGATYGFQKLSIDELSSLNAIELMNRTEQAHIEYYYEAAYYPSFPVGQYPPRSNESYISITAGLLAPVSRGSVTLQSNSIMDAPVIDLNVGSCPWYGNGADDNNSTFKRRPIRRLRFMLSSNFERFLHIPILRSGALDLTTERLLLEWLYRAMRTF